jgi:hypothetical protein
LHWLQLVVEENFFCALFLDEGSEFLYFSSAYLVASVSQSELL